ncbi:ATP-binding protein [Candidatus Saccharibacteria bacterium]|nr:ATP-binding protein [Candidatus Saccharibacteria bacterium]
MMEGNRKNRPRALLVFGAPASGKTTFAEKFAKKFGLAFYNLADLMEEHDFSRDTILIILEQILKTGQTVVLEGCLDTEKDRTEIRNVIRKSGYEPALVWVQTDISTIRQRLKTRYKSVSKAKDAYEKAVAEMEAPIDIEKPIILSGKHTFETQTRHVIAGLADL